MSVNEPVALSREARRPPWRLAVLCVLLLVGIGAAIARISLQSRVETLLQELRAAGLPTRGYEISKWRPAPAGSENGARALLEACDSIGRQFLTNNPGLAALQRRTNGWSAEVAEQISRAVVDNDAALEVIETALQAAKFGFITDFSNYAQTIDTPLPHLDLLRDAATLLWGRSALRSEAGEADAAAADIARLVDLARTLDGEPLLTSVYTRAAILRRAVFATERLLSRTKPNEAVCAQLIRKFVQGTSANVLQPALIGERAIVMDHFDIHWQMTTTAAPGGAGEFSGATKRLGQAALTASGFMERQRDFYLRTMQSAIDLSAKPPPASLQITNLIAAAEKKADDKLLVFSAAYLMYIANAAKADATLRAQVALARAALEVRRFEIAHGNFSETLNELGQSVPSDPFDGKHLRYRRSPEGFSLWSVGPDGVDNGGARGSGPMGTSHRNEPYDIVFTVDR